MAAWVEELNAWKQAQVAEWVAMPGWADPQQNTPGITDPASHVRGGRGLIDGYCVPPGELSIPPSVVMGRHLDGSGMPPLTLTQSPNLHPNPFP